MHDLWTSIAEPHLLSPEQRAKLDKFLELLVEANKTMNLTRVVDPEQAKLLHIADALTLLPYIPKETRKLADIGSGSGVPGIPLAIALPEVDVHLIEATGKKCVYLRNTAKVLGLRNVFVHNLRAEDAGHCPLRETCDIVTARAVGAMVWIAEWCLPLARKGGKVLAMKGAKITEEMPDAFAAIRMLGGGKTVIHPVTSLPGQTSHVIVEVPKISPTNFKLPRLPSVAKHNPLGPGMI